MNYKLKIIEILLIALIGIVCVIIVNFTNIIPVIGLSFGLVIIMRYIFEAFDKKKEKNNGK